MASRSFFSPRSTVNAITSQPWSLSQRIATDVSRPPEYARTSFLPAREAPGMPRPGAARPPPPLAGMSQQLFQRAPGAPPAQHRDDRVVARDSARDPGEGGLVDALRDQVRRPGRG